MIADEQINAIRFNQWSMLCDRYEVMNPFGQPIPFTVGEFQLLYILLTNAGRVISRETLLDLSRGLDYNIFDRSIDIMIGRIRLNLSDDIHEPQFIKTIRGVGYMFIANVSFVHNKQMELDLNPEEQFPSILGNYNSHL